MKRRDFLRGILPLATAAAVGSTLSFPLIASAAGNKRLVVIFQRGGCDGLNTIVPYGDDGYYNLRPTIAISPPNVAGPESAIAIDNDLFALHPALLPLRDVYLQGDMAIMPSVHYSGASRSHFSSRDLIERGFAPLANDGWLNRYLQLNQGGGELRAVSVGALLAESMRGPLAVPVINHINHSYWLNESLLNSMNVMYGENVGLENPNRASIHANGLIMLQYNEEFTQYAEENYTPDYGAIYPDSQFGAQLRKIAQLIKGNMGLEIATIDSHSWDTHRNQGGASGLHADRLRDFAEGIAAFYTDLGPGHMQDTLILTMTEFGRTAQENASQGTDHGWASSWMAFGGGVNGGIHGRWPGLSQTNLHDGRYLAHTIDSRDVIAEVVSRHLGQTSSLASVLPGHIYQTIGFV